MPASPHNPACPSAAGIPSGAPLPAAEVDVKTMTSRALPFTQNRDASATRYARRLLRSFFKRSLWMTIILTLLLALLLPTMIYLHHLKQYQEDSARLLQSFIDSEIGHPRNDFLNNPALLEAAVERINIFMGFSDFIEFKIWTGSGTLVYSYTTPSMAGRHYGNQALANLMRTGEPQIEIESAHENENANLASYGKLLEMYAPIRIDGELAGAVEVYRKVPPLNLIDAHLFCVLTVVFVFASLLYFFLFGKFKNAAATIIREGEKLDAAYNSLGVSYLNTIRSLLKALELRDMETEGHAERGVALAIFMAEKVGLTAAQLNQLVLGAYLHDIGKIGIPDQVLLKAGRLDDEERQVIQTHVTKGMEIIDNIAFLQPAADVILYHHESWDGTGYPKGLAKKEIPVTARIFAIVDVLEALLSKRPYKKALPFAKAREIILNERGTHFDPALVDIFAEIEEQELATIAAEIRNRGIHHEVNRAVEEMLRDFVAQQNTRGAALH